MTTDVRFHLTAGIAITDDDLVNLRSGLAALAAPQPASPPPPAIPPPATIPGALFALPWASTADIGRHRVSLKCEETLCVAIDVPPSASGTASLTVCEATGGPIPRVAVLSETALDFSLADQFTKFNVQTTGTPSFSIAVGSPRASRFTMLPGKRYYLNVQNLTRDGRQVCVNGQDASVFVDFYLWP